MRNTYFYEKIHKNHINKNIYKNIMTTHIFTDQHKITQEHRIKDIKRYIVINIATKTLNAK